MTPVVLFAGIPVTDFARAVTWHERLWQITESGWVYLVADPERAGNGLGATRRDPAGP